MTFWDKLGSADSKLTSKKSTPFMKNKETNCLKAQFSFENDMYCKMCKYPETIMNLYCYHYEGTTNLE